jgi:hypothetical protein
MASVRNPPLILNIVTSRHRVNQDLKEVLARSHDRPQCHDEASQEGEAWPSGQGHASYRFEDEAEALELRVIVGRARKRRWRQGVAAWSTSRPQ